MAKSIARQAIGGRPPIGRRQIGGRSGQANLQEPFAYGPGSRTFTPPKTGYWKFILHGPGGFGDAGTGRGGDSGAYCEKTVYLTTANTIAMVIGQGGSGTSTTATLPGGVVPTAGAGANGSVGAAPGVASGGDLMFNGTAGLTGAANPGLGPGGGAGGVGAAPGPGAPGTLNYPGGAGGSSTGALNSGNSPGAGGSNNGSANFPGGDGRIEIVFVRA